MIHGRPTPRRFSRPVVHYHCTASEEIDDDRRLPGVIPLRANRCVDEQRVAGPPRSVGEMNVTECMNLRFDAIDRRMQLFTATVLAFKISV